MAEFSVSGKRVVVVGAGSSGVAAAELLLARGARVTLAERQPAHPKAEHLRRLGIDVELGDHRPETFDVADLIVLSPGVALTTPVVASARAAGVPVIGEVELASRWLKGRIVAVTGTKGKSTTTTLIGRMLKEAGIRTVVGGNIGDPLTGQVEGSTADAVHVIEVSSFQLETAERFHPWIAVLLNFSPDHLDRHADLAEYAAAKQRIFANQTPDDWVVVNAEDKPALDLAAVSRARHRRFALSADIGEGVVIRRGFVTGVGPSGERPFIPLEAVRLVGRHLLADVVAAAAVADVAGVQADAMSRAVRSFNGLEHAMEVVGVVDGVRFINDSKATNIDAALHSIESIDTDLVPILGGRFKGGDPAALREPIAARARKVVAIGESRALFREALSAVVPVVEAATLRDAVREAWAAARPAGTVLLAPACSSFDMFANYRERGEAFKREVADLARERRARER
jgi:UDP-N-acetylmuramoylalanine--D-glutamate ligase